MFQFLLEKSETTLGRSQECDLILSGDTVSRQHALLAQGPNGVWLMDTSSQGTQINGRRAAAKSQLQVGDVVAIADWELHLLEAEHAAPSLEKTRETQGFTKNLPPSLPEAAELDTSTQGARLAFPLLVIQTPDGKTARHIMKKKTLVLGSAPDCDVVLNDEFVSGKHTRVSVTERGFLIEDLDSTNGTWVDEARVQQICMKQSQKMLLGQTQILVSLKSETFEKIEPIQADHFCGMIGKSEIMRLLFAKIQKVAATDMTTLILGETGSGKEMVAKAVHDLSARRAQPFVVVNCGAISPQLIESELFGHEKGAFTGAEKQHKGVFEEANGGTLFLDEIGELPLDLQSKVLRVLEYKTLRRVGGDSEIKVDVRLVAATHRDLQKKVAEKTFREDLFYRLYVLPLGVPSLKQRLGDIADLCAGILQSLGNPELKLDPQALAVLQNHNWPGNVRELKNTLLRAVAFCDGHTLKASDIDILEWQADTAATPSNEERQRILDALAQSQGDKGEAARILGMGRSTLFRKIKQLGL